MTWQLAARPSLSNGSIKTGRFAFAVNGPFDGSVFERNEKCRRGNKIKKNQPKTRSAAFYAKNMFKCNYMEREREREKPSPETTGVNV